MPGHESNASNDMFIKCTHYETYRVILNKPTGYFQQHQKYRNQATVSISKKDINTVGATSAKRICIFSACF